MAVSLAAAEEEKRPARVAPEQVLLTLPSDNEAVEFCTALGEVQAKSGMGYGAGEESVRSTIRQRAAAMGANVVQMRPPALNGLMIMSGQGTAYRCSEEALAKQKAKAAGIAPGGGARTACQRACRVRSGRGLRAEMVAGDPVASGALDVEVPERDRHADHDGRTDGDAGSSVRGDEGSDR
jgi:hypothetical protein